MDLSILCVTRGDPAVLPCLREQAALAHAAGAEFVVAADRPDAATEARLQAIAPRVVRVASAGYIESVLAEAVAACAGDYVLRLDDDETASPLLATWVADGGYRAADHWQVPRAWLWGTGAERVAALWPDHQTRLSVRAKAGGSTHLHGASPFGHGALAPGAILHHILRLQSRAERVAHLARYEALRPGAGGPPFTGFYLPEDEPGFAAVPFVDPLTGAEALRRAGKLRMPMAQHGDEILPCVEWILRTIGRPTRAMEIGTQHGGTAALWCELTDGLPGAQVVSIDMPLGIHGGIPQADMDARNARLLAAYPHFVAVNGNSQAQGTAFAAFQALDGPVDLLLIDGDHRYECARQDFEIYRQFVRPGGIVLFHDIIQTPFYDTLGVTVSRLWAELDGEKHEFNIHHREWGGIGALRVAS